MKLAEKVIKVNILAIEIISAISELVSKGKIPNPHAVMVVINETRELVGNPYRVTWKTVKKYMTNNLKIKEI